jgi:hypothetical protein
VKSPVLDSLKAKLSGKKKPPSDLADAVAQEKVNPPILGHFEGEARPSRSRSNDYLYPSYFPSDSTLVPPGDYTGKLVKQPIVRVDSSGNVSLIGMVKMEFQIGPSASWDLELRPDGKTFYTAEEVRAIAMQKEYR